MAGNPGMHRPAKWRQDMSEKNFFLFAVYDDSVTIRQGQHGERHVLHNVDDYVQYRDQKADELGVTSEQLKVYRSSTMDFPDESTNNRATIALAHEISFPHSWRAQRSCSLH